MEQRASTRGRRLSALVFLLPGGAFAVACPTILGPYLYSDDWTLFGQLARG